MARPKKTTVDYFPHYVHHGKILYILEANYRNDGYAFFYKLLELLADTEGHYYNCSTAPAWKFLIAKTLVSEVSAAEILETLAEMEIIDKNLWSKRIIWMQSFVDSIGDVYKKRYQKVVSAPEMPVSATETLVSGIQSKVKEIKLNKRTFGSLEEGANSTEILTETETLAIPLINLMYDEIRKLDTGFNRSKKQLSDGEWLQSMDKLIRLDKRDPKEIEKLIKWVYRDQFWKANILSPKKLREKYSQLKVKMTTGKGSDMSISDSLKEKFNGGM